jgi:uncharacterized tellurite resistance protein B-like protein
MKEHVETITNLLLGAAYADKRLEGDEIATIERVLCALLGSDELPQAQRDQISSFSPAKFDVAAAAATLEGLGDDRRKVLEMITAIHDADEELDLAEDAYLGKAAAGMGLSDQEYKDLTLQIVEVDELSGSLAD